MHFGRRFSPAFLIAAMFLTALLLSAATLTPGPTTVAATVKPTSMIPSELSTPLAPLIAIHPRQLASELLPRLISAILILAFGWGFATLVHKLLLKILIRVNSQVRMFTSRLVYIVIWILSILWVLSVFQVQVGTLTAIVGTLGLALSLASQDLAKNFISGIYLLIEHPFKVGDMITYANFTGRVDFIDLRTTMITTEDDQMVIIPNSLLMSQVVTRKLNRSPGISKNPDQPNQKDSRLDTEKRT